MILLGIETSCDETALALYDSAKGLLGHVLHSQTKQLTKHGGVIPEVAARYHIEYLTPLLQQLLSDHGLTLADLNFIAYTKGPGLIGSLLTGITFAKSLSLGLNIPALGINHLEGHLLACFIKEAHLPAPTMPTFPFLILLASGGHTMLIHAKSFGDYQILGETLDDAAGEALDKTAKLLGITPPNGKELAGLASYGQGKDLFNFPRPLTAKPNNLNFSFSGLKTAALIKINQLKSENKLADYKLEIAYAFQEAVMDTLTIKCKQALLATGLNQLVIAGGVSANLSLRNKLTDLENNCLINNQSPKIFFPKLEFCTDNGAMIAQAAIMRAERGLQDQNLDLEAFARWDLSKLD
jgi:N6-L-threonylcarbamoyladenine synthase